MFKSISSFLSRTFNKPVPQPQEKSIDAAPTSEIESRIVSEPVNQARIDYLIKHFNRNDISEDVPSTTVDPRDEYAKYGGVDAELLTIDLMEGHDFECWCANVLKDMDFDDVEVTPGSGDHGVDILAEKDSIKYAIQCKRYAADLGNTPIQEVHAGKYMYHCHVGVVITNRYFTRGAIELAEVTGVLLWDRDWIKKYLARKSSPDGSLSFAHSEMCNSQTTIAPDPYDDMLPSAISVVLSTKTASISTIQRHLRLGYARAARLIIDMEEIGIIGPFNGSHPREIYLTQAEWKLVQEAIDIPN